jgi:chromosome partitioning protein
MKKIAIGNLKGGIGKSSTSYFLAGYLTKKKKKVLLWDCDPQGNSTNNVGFDRNEYDYFTTSDILEKLMVDQDINPSDVIIKQPNLEIPYLDIIASDINLTATEMRLTGVPAREKMIDDYLEKHISFFSKYDYIIFDLSPSIGAVNQSALFTADDIILVSDIDINAIEGVKLLNDLWEGMSKKFRISNNIKGIIINKYKKTTKLSKYFVEFLQDNQDIVDLSFKTFIPENEALKQAIANNLPIQYYNTKSEGYKAFNELMKEFKERGII